MPVLLEVRGAESGGTVVAAPANGRYIDIALLNNLSDGGLKSGERQFIGLLEAAAGDLVVRLKLYSLPGIDRGPATLDHMASIYSDLTKLLGGRVDGLIVTGCEPAKPRLPDEPFWPGLTGVIDWAEHNTTSTIWSCLAAHAAVLHLDGIERRPLDTKRSGVYSFKRLRDHPLLSAGGANQRVPHSRFNDLDTRDLAAHGYDVLTRSSAAGVDMFVKQWRSLFVYCQGHPEYDATALAREYRRDVLRFVNRESDGFPAVPDGYFLKDVERALQDFEVRARVERTPRVMSSFPIDFWSESLRIERWRQDSTALIRNWLHYLAEKAS